eukprot:scaffold313756_cov14-Tisochrysis_lutea.AAC.1
MAEAACVDHAKTTTSKCDTQCLPESFCSDMKVIDQEELINRVNMFKVDHTGENGLVSNQPSMRLEDFNPAGKLPAHTRDYPGGVPEIHAPTTGVSKLPRRAASLMIKTVEL